MHPIVLRDTPSAEDNSWVFQANVPRPKRPGMGKHISFSPKAIVLDMNEFPMNRILNSDDLSKFILVSFGELRFPDTGFAVGRDYIIRVFQKGLFLNGVQYRFYGHSNSQLVRTKHVVSITHPELTFREAAVASFGKRIAMKNLINGYIALGNSKRS